MMKLCPEGERLFQDWINTVNDDRQTSLDNKAAKDDYLQHKGNCDECQSFMLEYHRKEYQYARKSQYVCSIMAGPGYARSIS